MYWLGPILGGYPKLWDIVSDIAGYAAYIFSPLSNMLWVLSILWFCKLLLKKCTNFVAVAMLTSVWASIRAFFRVVVSLAFEQKSQEGYRGQQAPVLQSWLWILQALGIGTNFGLARNLQQVSNHTLNTKGEISIIITIIYFERVLNFSSP